MKPLFLALSAILLLTVAGWGQNSEPGNRRMPARPLTGARPSSTQRAIINIIGGIAVTITAVMARRSRSRSGPAITAGFLVAPVVATPSLRSRSRACRASFDLG